MVDEGIERMKFGVEIEISNLLGIELFESRFKYPIFRCAVENEDILCGKKGCRFDKCKYCRTFSAFRIKRDQTIKGRSPYEIVTPILKGADGFGKLKHLCSELDYCMSEVNESCGLHVHIGAANMTDAHYIRIIRNYQRLEALIDSFMPLSRRANNNGFCRSLQGFDFSRCTTKRDVYDLMNSRYYKINGHAYFRHQTIEFRQHSGTTDYTKISMWIQFLAALVKYSEKNEITSCNSIDEIPFLNAEQKAYFNNRRASLN